MCEEFECIHQQNGICNFDDRQCEGECCVNYNDCGQCRFAGTGCIIEYGENKR